MKFKAIQEENGTWHIVQINDRNMVTATIGIIYSEYFAKQVVKLLNRQVGVKV